MRLEKFTYTDKCTSELRIFEASKESKTTTFLILPALGVRAKFYDTLADSICLEGYGVVIADWRGNGSFSIRASRKVNFGYEELIQDTYEIIQHIRKKAKKITILGHSLGAQLGCLLSARYELRVDKLVLIATVNVHYKSWTGFKRYACYLVGLFFYPVSKIFGYFPGRQLGFGDRESMGVMKDWCRNIRTGNYVIDNSYFYYEEALKNLKKDTLAISIEGDHYAPKQGLINLYSKFANREQVKHVHLKQNIDSGVKFNHFNWVKNPQRIVKILQSWMDENP